MVYAKYINCTLFIPTKILDEFELMGTEQKIIDGEKYGEFFGDNTIRDVTGYKGSAMYSFPTYGPARFVPLLPHLTQELISFQLNDKFPTLELKKETISWNLNADNAQPSSGKILLSEIGGNYRQ